MEDSNVTGTELELGTTTNVADVAEQEVPATEAVETSGPTSVRDAVLKAFEKTSNKEATTALPKLAEPEAQKAEPAKEVDPITGRELEPIRAPGRMTPTLREKWGTVPREMQKFWVDRERDMQSKLQETASERKLANEFTQIVSPYEDMLRQHGTNAVAHAKDLFNLDHQLRTGSGAVKAQIIHSLITHFQPDVQTLVQLANGSRGQPAPEAQQTPDVQAMVRKEMEELARTQAEGKQEAEVQSTMESFAADPKNEFLDDLKPLMAKAIEAGFVEGKDFNELFRNAYDFAAKQHPEVSQVLAGRANASVQGAANPTTKPVQSVKPSLASGGRGGQTQPRFKSAREAVEAAWNKHTGN
jgi:hypothetical protein